MDPRIERRCASVTALIGKNYSLGAEAGNALAHAGVKFHSSSVPITSDAAERLVYLDNLCRSAALGLINEETWARSVEQYTIASATAAAQKNDPVITEELKKNLEEIQTAVQELAGAKGVESPPKRSSDEIVDAASKESGESIHQKLDAIQQHVGRFPEVSDAFVRTQLLRTEQKVDSLMERVESLKSREIPQPEPRPQALPKWHAARAFRVSFGYAESFLDDSAKAVLREQLVSLADALDYRIEVLGFTDATGSPSANARLSQLRADEVRRYIAVDLRLDPSKVFASGRSVASVGFKPGAESRVVEVRVTSKVASPAIGPTSDLPR